MKLTKELLQERMPITCQTVDAFRAIFGANVKILWAKEGDFEVGKLPKVHSVNIVFDPDEPKFKPRR